MRAPATAPVPSPASGTAGVSECYHRLRDDARPLPRAAADPRRVAVVLKGYPRLSETFIAQELAALERRGLSLALYSLRHPTDRAVHPVHGEIAAPVTYLPEYLHEAPMPRAAGLARRPPAARLRARRLRSLSRRLRPRPHAQPRCAASARRLVLAAELPPDIVHLHAHFLHTPASVARYAALVRSLPWSVSAHAKDVWTTPDWEKREKLARCAWATTCTRANAEHLRALAPTLAQVDLVYHGLDASRFPPRPPDPAAPGDARPVVILSVGRAVEKKGYDDLLAALARLPAALDWRFEHVGSGPLLQRSRSRHRRSASRSACAGSAPSPNRTCSSAIAPRTSSCSRRASRATATATACPTC